MRKLDNENYVFISIKKHKNQIEYNFDISGEIKQCFNIKDKITVEYDMNIEKCPDSIAILPMLSIVLPVTWVENAMVIVDEIDQDFLECIDIVKRNYAFMLPKYNFAGKLRYNKIIKNSVKHSKNKTLCLFSGGVDATLTVLNNINSKPTLLTIWGSDIPIEKVAAWKRVEKQTRDFAKSFNLPCTFVKSKFRYLLDEGYLSKKYQDWWHDFQHGIGLICQVAPYVYMKNISTILIASSFSAKTGSINICASSPFIDENIKYAGCRVIHDGFQMTRLDKVRFISNYSKKYNRHFNLRVCWEQFDEDNCCVCEKCARTILQLFAVGADPQNFGFNLTDEKINTFEMRIKNKDFCLSRTFNLQEVAEELATSSDNYNKQIFEAIFDNAKIKPKNSNFIKTQIEKIQN